MTNTLNIKQRNHIDFATRFAIGKLLETVIERQNDTSFYSDGWNDARVASNFPGVKGVQIAQIRKNLYPDFIRRHPTIRRKYNGRVMKLNANVNELRTQVEALEARVIKIDADNADLRQQLNDLLALFTSPDRRAA